MFCDVVCEPSQKLVLDLERFCARGAMVGAAWLVRDAPRPEARFSASRRARPRADRAPQAERVPTLVRLRKNMFPPEPFGLTPTHERHGRPIAPMARRARPVRADTTETPRESGCE